MLLSVSPTRSPCVRTYIICLQLAYVTLLENFVYQDCRKFEGWMRRKRKKKKKDQGKLFLRFYIRIHSGESHIPVSLPYAWSELFLTSTPDSRMVNTISIKSRGKQTFWCGWYLFATCRQVDLIRTAFTTSAKHFETGWHAQQLLEPEWHFIPRLHLISTGDGLINDN